MESEKFEQFFRVKYEQQLLLAASKGEKAIEVDFGELDKFDPELADKLLNDPAEILTKARKAIKNIDLPQGSTNIEPRFTNIPEAHRIRIRNLRAEHIGKLISVEGVVRIAAEVKPQINIGIFECPDCGSKIQVTQDENILKLPEICSCGRKSNFNLIDTKLFDSRVIKIEEPYEETSGDKPGEIRIYLKSDLTTPLMQRKTDPGNRIRVGGTLREMKKNIRGKMGTQMDIFMEANHIESTEIEWEEVIIEEEDEKKIIEFGANPEIYKILVNSLAPSIYGMSEIKEAIALQLFGGTPQIQADGVKIRGDIHILLLGDPWAPST